MINEYFDVYFPRAAKVQLYAPSSARFAALCSRSLLSLHSVWPAAAGMVNTAWSDDVLMLRRCCVGTITPPFPTFTPHSTLHTPLSATPQTRTNKVGAELRATTGQPLKWMTFSYIVSLYIDCPPGMLLHCPGAAALATFSAAVKARDIVWPAFPTNAELAIGDASILSFVRQLDAVSSFFGHSPRCSRRAVTPPCDVIYFVPICAHANLLIGC